MLTTFHHVKITVEAPTPEAAYTRLCEILAGIQKKTLKDYDTDTFSTDTDPTERDTCEIQLTPNRKLQQQLSSYDELFAWLLGEHGDFPERPPKKHGLIQPLYWWRSALRQRLVGIRSEAMPVTTSCEAD